MDDHHKDHRQRKRDQFYDHGSDAMADHEILELLLFYAIPRKDVNPLAHELIDAFGSLEAVFAAEPGELEQIDGVGKNTAVLLKLIPHLLRRAHLSSVRTETPLDTVERIGKFFSYLFIAEKREVMYQLCLDAKGRKLSCRRVAEGDPAAVAVNIRDIVQNALRCNAVMVVLAHNHPSGVAFPSHADKLVTDQIRDALSVVNVQLVDHIVVADHDFISFREDGLL